MTIVDVVQKVRGIATFMDPFGGLFSICPVICNIEGYLSIGNDTSLIFMMIHVSALLYTEFRAKIINSTYLYKNTFT